MAIFFFKGMLTRKLNIEDYLTSLGSYCHEHNPLNNIPQKEKIAIKIARVTAVEVDYKKKMSTFLLVIRAGDKLGWSKNSQTSYTVCVTSEGLYTRSSLPHLYTLVCRG